MTVIEVVCEDANLQFMVDALNEKANSRTTDPKILTVNP